jgi:hypothetical protein
MQQVPSRRILQATPGVVCLVLWCKVHFKSTFRLKMHQNNFFSDLFFIFDISTSKPLESTKKSINLMFFQAKRTQKQF